MQVRGKIFPYPVINHNKLISNFNNLEFSLSFEEQDDEISFILKDAMLSTDSNSINDLVERGLVGIALIVECSETVIRRSFEISKTPRDITLLKVDFTEKVEISMFAYAKDNFVFSSNETDEDYSDIDFEIDKYDILGVYDGFPLYFKHDESEDNLAQSIFSININHDLEDGKYNVECDIGRKISITLSENDYKNYKIIYTVPTYKEVFFNMLLVPSLIEALSLCKVMINDGKDLEDVGNTYIWFRSILSAYKKLFGHDLTVDEFKNLSPVTLAQELLGKPIGESLSKLVKETNKNVEEDYSND